MQRIFSKPLKKTTQYERNVVEPKTSKNWLEWRQNTQTSSSLQWAWRSETLPSRTLSSLTFVFIWNLDIRDLMDKLVCSSLIHFRFEAGQTCFLNCNLCWMGGHLSIHAVVYPPNIFYIVIEDIWWKNYCIDCHPSNTCMIVHDNPW